jgi:hypothetical protein
LYSLLRLFWMLSWLFHAAAAPAAATPPIKGACEASAICWSVAESTAGFGFIVGMLGRTGGFWFAECAIVGGRSTYP